VIDIAEPTSEGRDDLWPAVNALLAGATPEGARVHALGPLEAFRRNTIGASVPETLAMEARMAAFGMLSVRPLLERVRRGCDGPLVLMKGPEVALRYPGAARGFIDIDLLVPEPRRAHDQLREAGFIEAGDYERFQPRHHLRPLQWPGLPLRVEIHGRLHWPDGLKPPAADSIIGSAGPSRLGLEGILAPDEAQHAILVAAHAWAHEPLWRVRDLLDTRALAPPSSRPSIERTARAWNVRRLWQVTDRVTNAVLGTGRMPLVVRPWAAHLLALRERTVLENHLRDVMAAYWALPFASAVATSAHAIAYDLLPAPEEGWSDKISRMLTASRNATKPLSQHDLQLGEAATRGRNRDHHEDDDTGANDAFE
jgi:Uncharacterised nucleotidyltransferase